MQRTIRRDPCQMTGPVNETFASVRPVQHRIGVWTSIRRWAGLAIAGLVVGQVPLPVAATTVTARTNIGSIVCAGEGIASGIPNVDLLSQHTCSTNLGTATADARAMVGTLGVAVSAQAISNVTIPMGDNALATFVLDDIRFSRTTPGGPASFATALHMHLDGEFRMSPTDPLRDLFAQSLVTLGFGLSGNPFRSMTIRQDGLDPLILAGDATLVGSVRSGSLLQPTGAAIDADLTVGGWTVSPDVSYRLSVSLNGGAFGRGAGARAAIDFADGLGFLRDTDVFDLPAGFTVNAGSTIVNNRWMGAGPVEPAPVPEPPVLALLFVMAGGLTGLRLRRRSLA